MSLSRETQIEVEQFLFEEAALLEENRLREWLDLFTEEVRYYMPIRRNVQPDNDTEAAPAFAYYDDDKTSLELRVRRIETGVAHAESPVSVTQRLITNVRVQRGEKADELIAHSSFLVHQERRDRHSASFIGKRRDALRREGAALKIAGRQIHLAQTILPATISIFF